MQEEERKLGAAVSIAENRARIAMIEEDQRKQWTVIEKLRERLDRLPAWATLMMTGLGVVSGSAVTAAIALAVR